MNDWIDHAMSTAKSVLEKDHGLAVDSVPGNGYRVLTDTEIVRDLSTRRIRQAAREARRTVRTLVRTVKPENLSEEDKRALSVRMALGATIAYLGTARPKRSLSVSVDETQRLCHDVAASVKAVLGQK